MPERLAQFILFFPVFLFSLSFHEASHAWMASRLGDPTAKFLGRLTLNPLAHIDWIGTFLFPLMMFLMPGLILVGWAKPVPVDPRNLRGGRKGNLKVALAGPLSNIILALCFAGILHAVQPFASHGGTIFFLLLQMLEIGVFLNLMLASFNLIPIPPLDGSQILEGLLPYKYLEVFHRFSRYGFLILLAGLYLGFFRYISIIVYGVAGRLLP